MFSFYIYSDCCSLCRHVITLVTILHFQFMYHIDVILNLSWSQEFLFTVFALNFWFNNSLFLRNITLHALQMSFKIFGEASTPRTVNRGALCVNSAYMSV